MAVIPPQAIPRAAMVTTIVTESSLLLSWSHLTSPLSKLRTLIKKSRQNILPRFPQGKARLINGEGSVCQTTCLSLSTEFDKAAACFEELQFAVTYTKALELKLNIHS